MTQPWTSRTGANFRPFHCFFFLVFGVTGAFFTLTQPAAGQPEPDATVFILNKSKNYEQDVADPDPVFLNYSFLSGVFIRPGHDITSASITPSGLTPSAFTLNFPGTGLFHFQEFTLETTLETAFPNGSFQFDITGAVDGLVQPTVNIAPTGVNNNDYPNSLFINNLFDFDNVDPNWDFYFDWNLNTSYFPSGDPAGVDDSIRVRVWELDGSGNLVQVVHRENLTTNDTSTFIPASVLEPGVSYLVRLQAFHGIELNVNDYPGVFGIVSYSTATLPTLVTAPVTISGTVVYTGSQTGGILIGGLYHEAVPLNLNHSEIDWVEIVDGVFKASTPPGDYYPVFVYDLDGNHEPDAGEPFVFYNNKGATPIDAVTVVGSSLVTLTTQSFGDANLLNGFGGGTATYTGGMNGGVVDGQHAIWVEAYNDAILTDLYSDNPALMNGANYRMVTYASTYYLLAWFDADGDEIFDVGEPYTIHSGKSDPPADPVVVNGTVALNITFDDTFIRQIPGGGSGVLRYWVAKTKFFNQDGPASITWT